MPSLMSLVARAHRVAPPQRALLKAALPAAAALALAGCSPLVSVENADVPQWRATALPAAADAVIGDSGKILNRDRIVKETANVPAGSYTLAATCEGGGKAFFEVSLDGERVVDAGAACNGSRETTKITLPAAGRLAVSTSSVDAPLIYAYQLTPAG